MKNIYLLILFFLCANNLLGQEKGILTITKDPLIDSLIEKRLALSKTATKAVISSGKTNNTSKDVVAMGYRVQIFYGSDRREVFAAQTKFKGNYPKLNTYITYNAPNYYLRVGDFRTRMEAQNYLGELKPMFPTLFIFKERINLPETDN